MLERVRSYYGFLPISHVFYLKIDFIFGTFLGKESYSISEMMTALDSFLQKLISVCRTTINKFSCSLQRR